MVKLDSLIKSILDNMHEGAYMLDNNKFITYWNRGAERITGYTFNEVVGKCCNDNILLHSNGQGENLCCGRCPVSKTLLTGLVQAGDVYLSHKEGYLVPVSISVIPIRSSDGYIINAIQFFEDNSSSSLGSEKINQL